MSAGLRDLKRRIVAVKSIKGVTTAMGNIASAKLEGSMKNLKHSREYAADLEKLLFSVAQERKEAPTSCRHYVFGSDTGLCGSVNTNLMKQIRKDFQQQVEDGVTPSFVLSGEKIKVSMAKDPTVLPHLDLCVANIQKTINFTQVATVCEDLFSGLEAVDQEIFWYQAMEGAAKFKISNHVIPQKDQIAAYFGADCEINGDYDVNQNLQEFLTFTSIWRSQAEQEASENASRAAAMQNAAKAAGDMIDVLELKYRKARQAKITTEIIEISTGAAAVMAQE